MTDLQLKIMQRADKTLSFGCIIKGYSTMDRNDIGYMRYVCNEEEKSYQPRRVHVNSEERSFMDPDEGFDYDIIGHTYGYDRLEYLYEISPISDTMVNAMADIDLYIANNDYKPLLKPCIDRPEEGQKLVLDFLKTLP